MANGTQASELPAWPVDRQEALRDVLRARWPLGDARAWAWSGSTGAGVRVCILDSGVDREQSLGVLKVLDQGATAQSGLADMALLGRFATHAAMTLAVVEATRRGQALLADGGVGGEALARVARALDSVEGPRHDAAVALLEALETLLHSVP